MFDYESMKARAKKLQEDKDRRKRIQDKNKKSDAPFYTQEDIVYDSGYSTSDSGTSTGGSD